MLTLTVFLVKQTEATFAGHSVQATFKKRETPPGASDDTEPLVVSAKLTSAIDANDQAVFSLPDLEIMVGGILLEVVAPDGDVLASELLVLDNLQPEVRIPVDPKVFAPLQPNEDPGFGAPATLRGRVIDRAGKREIAGVQVILFGTASGDSKAFPLLAATTDGRGYFFGSYPVGSFASVEGAIGIEGVDNVPVRLLEDGSLPANVILVIDLAEDAVLPEPSGDVPRQPGDEELAEASETFHQDVGGGCVDFHKPNRTLESAEYFSVVRTTEPEIKGLTLTDPPRINIKDLVSIVRPKTIGLVAARSETPQPQPSPGPIIRRGGPIPGAVAQPAAAFARAASASLAEIPDLVDIADLSERLERGDEDDREAAEIAGAGIDADIAATLTQDPDGFSLSRLASAELSSNVRRLDSLLDRLRIAAAGRSDLDCETPVDWDLTPTIYQACTVAHGHVLKYRQDWVADGYSLGDLVYSLPLAPCQKKNIVVVDWERRETAARQESLEEEEQLSAFLSRDRDVSEVVRAVVSEEMEASSSAGTSAFGGGIGVGAILGPVGGLLGLGGGFSSADAQATQRSSRSTAASTMQKLRDRTRQAASSVRNQRATVVQTVRQGETVRAETEVVANHNHCHAMTIQWFEVLRHLLVRTRLVEVQECLFVPLLMSRFDSHKALRHREPLSRFLRNRRLRPGFEAIERIVNSYAGSDLPTGSFAEEEINALDGFIRLRIRIARPRDGEDGVFQAGPWEGIERLLGISAQEFHRNFLEGQNRRDQIFAQQLGEQIAQAIVDALRLSFMLDDGSEASVPIDPTLVSRFRNGSSHYVSLRLSETLQPVRRIDISAVRISIDPLEVSGQGGDIEVDDALPPGSRLIVDGGQVRYRTEHIAYDLFRNSRIRNDLTSNDPVLVFTPPGRRELENPREKDKEAARRLLKHLNEHLEYYHRVTWSLMDANRRFLLLDGFTAPNSDGRSIASVVENRLIGIAGNCLVMPVAAGFHLDPTFSQDQENPVDLIEHYQPENPEPPLPISLPTKGVFAEAVLGKCNSCEEIDESRFWRWEESPCPDDPTPIQEPSTESRQTAAPDLSPTMFPSPLIALQNAPNAPDPTGLAAALTLLGNANLFRDITGLDRTQQNALEALRGALSTAVTFGQGAAGLATTGAQLQFRERLFNSVKKAKAEGLINEEQAADLFGKIITGSQQQAKPDKEKQADKKAKAAEKKLDAVQKAKDKGQVSEQDAKKTSKRIVDDLAKDEGPATAENLKELGEAAGANQVNLKGDFASGESLEATALAATGATAPGGPAIAANLGVMNQVDRAFRQRSQQLRNAIGAAAAIERAFWENNGNQLVEGDAAVLSRLEDYARSAGVSDPAAKAAEFAANADPWSGAFIAHVMAQAGLTSAEFVFNVGHDEYIKSARDSRKNRDFMARFWLCALNEVAPDIGDVLVMNRSGGTVSFNPAIAGGGLPSNFSSHGDVMTAISVTAAGDPALATLGGNISQSVRRRIVPTDDAFKVTALSHLEVEPAALAPDNYFAIVRLRESIFEVYP